MKMRLKRGQILQYLKHPDWLTEAALAEGSIADSVSRDQNGSVSGISLPFEIVSMVSPRCWGPSRSCALDLSPILLIPYICAVQSQIKARMRLLARILASSLHMKLICPLS